MDSAYLKMEGGGGGTWTIAALWPISPTLPLRFSSHPPNSAWVRPAPGNAASVGGFMRAPGGPATAVGKRRPLVGISGDESGFQSVSTRGNPPPLSHRGLVPTPPSVPPITTHRPLIDSRAVVKQHERTRTGKKTKRERKGLGGTGLRLGPSLAMLSGSGDARAGAACLPSHVTRSWGGVLFFFCLQVSPRL